MSTFCSCIICKKEFSVKGFHSHYIRSHTIEGNIATKMYGNLSIQKTNHNTDQKNNINRIQYANNPSHCKECDCCLPYDSRHNKFCNNSCAATFNNNLRVFNGYKMSVKSRQLISEKNISRYSSIYTKVSYCKICNKWFPGTTKTCSTICRNISFSLTAKKSKLGGNKNTRAYGWYYSKFAGKVWLESSYEYKVAKDLDDNNIKWVRPSFLFYELKNVKKKYYPDFFLEDYNVYLDPKNDYLITQDFEKIECVMKQNNVRVLVLTKFQLSWNIIHSLL